MALENAARKPVVVVTGSSGRIGSAACRALAGRYCAVGLDRDAPSEASHAWIECDLTKPDSLRGALEGLARGFGREIASVLHLAAYYDFSGEPSPMYDELTVEGTRRLLRGLHAFQVGQFAFSSSTLVMRPVEMGEVIDESSPTSAEWAYPESKLAAERVIREQRGSIPSVVLRIAGVYDEGCHSIPLAQQLRRIREKELRSHLFPGNLEHGQAFVHLDDVVDCIVAVIDKRHELAQEELFLVGEPEVVGYGELQDIFGRALHGTRWTTLRIPAALAKVGAWIQEHTPGSDPFIRPWMIDQADMHMPVDITHAQRVLGWSPKHRLRDVAPEMARRLLQDPERWYEENGLEAHEPAH